MKNNHASICTGLFAMTEKRLQNNKLHNWVMCPTCRQHTDFGNIVLMHGTNLPILQCCIELTVVKNLKHPLVFKAHMEPRFLSIQQLKFY